MIDNAESITDMATKAGPALAVSGLTFFGISLPDLVQILTAIYVLILIAGKAWQMYRTYKGVNAPKE